MTLTKNLLILTIITLASCKGGGSSSNGVTPSTNTTPKTFSVKKEYLQGNGSGTIISSLISTRNNNIFLGVNGINNNETGIGLYRITNKGTSISKLDSSNGLLYDSINDIAEGPDGTIHATHYYLNYGAVALGYSKSIDSTGTSFTSITTPLIAKDKRKIAINSLGHIFVSGGTYEKSLDNGTSFSSFGTNGTDARIWIGKTSNNVYIYNSSFAGLQMSTDNGATFTNIGISKGLAGKVITSVKEDSLGNIYVASLESDSTSPGGLSVSSDNGTTFVQRLLPQVTVMDKTVFDIALNSSNILCIAHKAGFSCSKDSGYTWATYETSLGNNLIAITDDNIIASTNSVDFAIELSNGILPTNMGESYSTGTLSTITKASTLPTGTYTRTKSEMYSNSSHNGETFLTQYIATTNDVTLLKSKVDQASTYSVTSYTVKQFIKNSNGSIDKIDQMTVAMNLDYNNVFTGTITTTSPGTVNISAADITTNEAANKNPSEFFEYRWLSSNVLRITTFLSQAGPPYLHHYMFEDFTYTP